MSTVAKTNSRCREVVSPIGWTCSIRRTGPVNVTLFESLDDRFSLAGRNNAAVPPEQFEPVVRGGVMAGGNWMPPAAPVCRTRTPSVGVDATSAYRTTPACGQAALDGSSQHGSRVSAIVRDHDRTRLQLMSERAGVIDGDRGVQTLPDNSSQPGHAYDRFRHDAGTNNAATCGRVAKIPRIVNSSSGMRPKLSDTAKCRRASLRQP